MKGIAVISLIALITVLSGCSKPATPPAPAPSAASQAAPARQPVPTITKDNQGVLTDTQRDGLNGANQVSDVLNKAEEARRKQMKEQGL